MNDGFNIFRNIVVNENDCTELLCNILSIKAFRDTVLDVFDCGNLKKKVKPGEFNSQAAAVDARPDIEFKGEGYYVLVEIKTSAHRSLTAQQETGYSGLFAKNTDCFQAMIFLAPERYDHRNTIETETSAFLAAMCPPVACRFVSWEQLIVAVEDSGLHMASSFIGQFTELLRGWYIPPQIWLSYQEIELLYTKDVAIALKKLKRIVDSVRGLAEGFQVYAYRPQDQSEYGITFRDDAGQDQLFFGIWEDTWEEFGFPLCAAVYRDWNSPMQEVLEDRNMPFVAKWYEGWLVAEIPRSLVAKNDAPEEIWEFLKWLLDQRKKSGPDK